MPSDVYKYSHHFEGNIIMKDYRKVRNFEHWCLTGEQGGLLEIAGWGTGDTRRAGKGRGGRGRGLPRPGAPSRPPAARNPDPAARSCWSPRSPAGLRACLNRIKAEYTQVFCVAVLRVSPVLAASMLFQSLIKLTVIRLCLCCSLCTFRRTESERSSGH